MAAPITVLSVPTDHPYVQSLHHPGVIRLPDPTAPWWPHPALEGSYVREELADVYHLHFGYDDRTPAQLRELVAALSAVPLVLTVHDLRNPHHHDARQHDAALDVLIPAAAVIITLTRGAADEILLRWGQAAIVLPHPHVVPLDREPTRRSHAGFVVGVHLKSLRANIDTGLLLPLAEAVARVPGGRLQVDVHADVLDTEHPRHDPRLLPLLDGLDVRVHEPFSDEELYRYLEALDVSVLPYRFGTHSGWLEACFDLGTTVIAPDCGYFRHQQACVSYETGSGTSLAAAIRTAYDEPRLRHASRSERALQQLEVAAVHAELYRAVAGQVAA